MLRPCFGYFYKTFVSRYLKWLKFSLERLKCQLEEKIRHLILTRPDPIEARHCHGERCDLVEIQVEGQVCGQVFPGVSDAVTYFVTLLLIL